MKKFIRTGPGRRISRRIGSEGSRGLLSVFFLFIFSGAGFRWGVRPPELARLPGQAGRDRVLNIPHQVLNIQHQEFHQKNYPKNLGPKTDLNLFWVAIKDFKNEKSFRGTNFSARTRFSATPGPKTCETGPTCGSEIGPELYSAESTPGPGAGPGSHGKSTD